MSSEVEWVLDELSSVVAAVSEPLVRVNRDTSELLEDSARSMTGDLTDANFVGATLADVSSTPIGTEYDHRREAVVGVRIEGLHHSEWGHIDPDGVEGIAFDSLVNQIRDALLAQRTFPDAGGTDVSYTDLRIENEAPQSANYSDYFRHDLDVRFVGYENL
ncbi:hypothetical protein VB779_08680 [Haloarculaceae archaeon H-GB11]|nr:hypothetical protein [Haloarculaceae archaeon H-GB11]